MNTAQKLIKRYGFRPQEWEHYLTSMSDDGDSVFVYDNENGDTLRIYPQRCEFELKVA